MASTSDMTEVIVVHVVYPESFVDWICHTPLTPYSASILVSTFCVLYLPCIYIFVVCLMVTDKLYHLILYTSP